MTAWLTRIQLCDPVLGLLLTFVPATAWRTLDV